MPVEFKVKVSDLGIDSAKQARVVPASLAMFSGYFMKRVQGRFAQQGPNWPPRTEETASAALRSSAVKNLAQHRLKRKLEKELRRAQVKADRGKGSLLAIARRRAVLNEFNRQAAGGAVDLSKTKAKDKKGKAGAISAFLGNTKGSRKLQKSVAGLQQRQERAEAQASSRLLGRGGNSTYKKLSRSQLEVGNRIPWWGVQEEGGTVGHGAKIPPRPAYYVEEVDVEVLQEILVNQALKALGS